MATITILWVLLVISGRASALKRKLFTTDPVIIEKSLTLDSNLECAAWVNRMSLRPNSSFKYDKETGLCTIYKMMANSIYKAMQELSTEGTPYYVDVKCMPSTCSFSKYHGFHNDPSAFPPDLAMYVPMYALNGTSLSIEYYTTPSLTVQEGTLNMALWDQTFLDGSFPMWTPENYGSITTYYTDLVPTFTSLSMFAWTYLTTNMAKKDHPIVALVRGGSWSYATVLGAGHRTYGDRLSLSYSASSGQYYFIKSDEAIIQRGVWQHIGATYNADTGVATLYLNGEEIKSEFFNTGLQTYDLNQLNIHHTGKMEPSASGHNYCQGCATAHQEYYKRSLSAAEVQQVYYRGYTCSYPGDECTVDL